MRRGRALLLVSALATVVVVVTGAFALAESPGTGRSYEYGVRLSHLVADEPVAVPITLPGPDAARSRVVFVRRNDDVSAYLAVDPRLGCALLVPSDPDYDRLLGVHYDPERVLFYDNCGGAVYGADGRCNGGPCRRNLDEYPVRIEAGRARIDVRERRNGAPTNGWRSISSWCSHENPAISLAGSPPPLNCPGS